MVIRGHQPDTGPLQIPFEFAVNPLLGELQEVMGTPPFSATRTEFPTGDKEAARCAIRVHQRTHLPVLVEALPAREPAMNAAAKRVLPPQGLLQGHGIHIPFTAILFEEVEKRNPKQFPGGATKPSRKGRVEEFDPAFPIHDPNEFTGLSQDGLGKIGITGGDQPSNQPAKPIDQAAGASLGDSRSSVPFRPASHARPYPPGSFDSPTVAGGRYHRTPASSPDSREGPVRRPTPPSGDR